MRRTSRTGHRFAMTGWIATALGVAALLGTLLVGCDDDKPSKPAVGGSPVTVPLNDGAHWSYSYVMSIEEGSRAAGLPAGSRRAAQPEIRNAGTVAYSDGSYQRQVLRMELEDGTVMVDTTDYRQEGQVLLLQMEVADSVSGDTEFNRRYREGLRRSLPFKVADFTSPAGTGWTIFEIDDVVRIEGYDVRLTVNLSASNLGRTNVAVPAGNFEDVYKGRLRQTVIAQVGSEVVQLSSDQDTYLKSEVGPVFWQYVYTYPDEFGRDLRESHVARLSSWSLTPDEVLAIPEPRPAHRPDPAGPTPPEALPEGARLDRILRVIEGIAILPGSRPR